MSNFKYNDRNTNIKFNMEKENMKDYHQAEKFSIDKEKKTKSPLKSKFDLSMKFNPLSKSSSVPRDILNSEQIKNKDTLQGLGNNINISVNNLIINNPSPNLPVYPNNYGMYLSNSTLFSKLGNSIVSSNKKDHNYSPVNRGISKGKNNFNININTSNLGNFNKFQKNIIGKNIVDSVINNLAEIPNKSPMLTIGKMPTKDPSQSVEITDTQKVESKIKSEANGAAEEVFIMCSDEILTKHSNMWEILLDLESAVEGKHNLTVTLRKFSNFINDEILTKDLSFELFSNQNLNKGYAKLFKISEILLIYIKFILQDFNYENTLKINLKKMIGSINEHLVILLDNFLESTSFMRNISHELIEKVIKYVKLHKIKRPKDISNLGLVTIKNIEIVINSIKQFSNSFFKIGYFKPIHNICFDFFRLIENYTVSTLGNMVLNNVLYYTLYNTFEKKNQSNIITNKQIIFNQVTSYVNSLANISPPFLPPTSSETYTLVLDLDETLVHFFFSPSGGVFLIRPFCMEFLHAMSQMYELVIFTAAMKDYADSIIDVLDKDRTLIKHRLYRHHTSISGISFVKDLSKIGRDLSKVIIIDNLPENFKLQQNNGLFIKTWNDDMKDNQLNDFSKLLRDLFELKTPDVRTVLKKVKDEVGRRMKKNIPNPYANLDLSKYL